MNIETVAEKTLPWARAATFISAGALLATTPFFFNGVDLNQVQIVQNDVVGEITAQDLWNTEPVALMLSAAMWILAKHFSEQK